MTETTMGNELLNVGNSGVELFPDRAWVANRVTESLPIGESYPALPPTEEGKDVKFFCYRDRSGRAVVSYTSRVSKRQRQVLPMKQGFDDRAVVREGSDDRRKRVGAGTKFLLFLILLLIGFVALLFVSAANAQSEICSICGTEVSEWHVVTIQKKFDCLPRFLLTSIVEGNVTEDAENYVFCGKCYGNTIGGVKSALTHG